jgi:hypothetical protein
MRTACAGGARRFIVGSLRGHERLLHAGFSREGCAGEEKKEKARG